LSIDSSANVGKAEDGKALGLGELVGKGDGADETVGDSVVVTLAVELIITGANVSPSPSFSTTEGVNVGACVEFTAVGFSARTVRLTVGAIVGELTSGDGSVVS
jgi:hypothetical protein